MLDAFALSLTHKTNTYSLALFAGQIVKIRVSASASANSTNVATADFDNVSVSSINRIQWKGGIGNWSDAAMWLPWPPSDQDLTIVPAGSSVTVDLTNAQSANLRLDSASTLVIQPGAGLAVGSSAVNNGSVRVMNGGRLIWSPAIGGTTNGLTFVQNGTFEVDHGGSAGIVTSSDSLAGLTLDQTNGSTTVAGLLNCGNGTISVGGGTFSILSSGQAGNLITGGVSNSLAFIQTDGLVVLDGTLNADSTVLHGGTLQGAGTLNGNVVVDGALLAPGLKGSPLFAGNLTQSKTNTLLLELQGTQPGQFDQLRIGAAAQLNGALSVRQLPGFAPAIGDQLQIVSSTALNGFFSQVNLPAGISLAYTNNGVFLVVTGALRVLSFKPGLVERNFVFSFNSVTNQNYTVEQNADLASTAWTFFTNLVGTGGLIQLIAPTEPSVPRFFRVRQP